MLLYDCLPTDFQYLKEAITSKYGASDDSVNDLIEFLDLCNGQRITRKQAEIALSTRQFEYCSWNQGRNTIILLLTIPSQNQMLLYYGQQWHMIPQKNMDLEGL